MGATTTPTPAGGRCSVPLQARRVVTIRIGRKKFATTRYQNPAAALAPPHVLLGLLPGPDRDHRAGIMVWMHAPRSGPASSGPWSVIVPVKRPEVAKTRLADLAGPHRAAVARAFAADTVAAAASVPRWPRSWSSPTTPRRPTTHANGGRSSCRCAGFGTQRRASTRCRIRRATPAGRPGRGIVGLPALRPDELAAALRAAAAHSASFVGDVAGIGTTMYAVTDPMAFEPRSVGARERHTVPPELWNLISRGSARCAGTSTPRWTCGTPPG